MDREISRRITRELVGGIAIRSASKEKSIFVVAGIFCEILRKRKGSLPIKFPVVAAAEVSAEK